MSLVLLDLPVEIFFLVCRALGATCGGLRRVLEGHPPSLPPPQVVASKVKVVAVETATALRSEIEKDGLVVVATKAGNVVSGG